MVVTITQKCSCNYVFKEQKVIKILPLHSQNIVTCIPGRGPKFHKSADTKEEIVSTKVLEGDEPFKELNLYNNYAQRHCVQKLLICPKCGTVLDSSIVMDIVRKEDE